MRLLYAAKVLFEDGQAYTSDILAAIAYAQEMGTAVVNSSWGCVEENPALKETMTGADTLLSPLRAMRGEIWMSRAVFLPLMGWTT